MSSAEDIAAQIAGKGDEIRNLKSSGASKEDVQPHVDELLALKQQFKSLTGEDYVAPGQEKKKKKKKGDGGGEPKAEGEMSEKQKKKLEKKLAKEKAKAEAKAERERREAEARAQKQQRELEQAAAQAHLLGDLERIQSREISGKTWTEIRNLGPSMVGSEVLVRCHVQTCRAVGPGAFLLLRAKGFSVQGVCFPSKEVPKALVSYLKGLSKETVADVRGRIVAPDEPVTSASQSAIEMHILECHAVSRASNLPLQIADASRPPPANDIDEGAAAGVVADGGDGAEDAKGEDDVPTVGRAVRLNYRWIDLRTRANQGIFRISSGVCQLFREFLDSQGFVEIHTPKIIGGSSEGGADVFRLKYFDQDACLAQSPQLYKQMCCSSGDFERVMEIGPVFRAENSNTARHLCEFTGLDLEMTIKEHYYEVLDVFSDLFIHIFDGLNERYAAEIEAVREQYPFEDLQYHRPTLRLSFQEGIALLREAGYEADENEDPSTENERALGRIVKEKFGTDFFFLDNYPLAARPFYTMPNPANPTQDSNSYDFFIRGQEILSGAQRIHDPDLLEERANAHGIPIESIKSYIDSFRHGALPHGGGGIGLERVVCLFLGLPTVRATSLFPRTPNRLMP